MNKILYKTKINKCICDYSHIIEVLNEKINTLQSLRDTVATKESEHFEHNGAEVSVSSFIKEEEKNISIIEKVLDI